MSRIFLALVIIFIFLTQISPVQAQTSHPCPAFEEKDVLSCDPEVNIPFIMRFIRGVGCSRCDTVEPWYKDVVEEEDGYAGQVISRVLTKGGPTPPTGEEMDICFDMTDKKCYPVPITILGCHYVNLVALEGEATYKSGIKCAIDYLLGQVPSGWNRVVWPGVTGEKASDIPLICPISVARQNFWFRPYVRDFGGGDFDFESGETYWLRCG